MVRTAHFCSHEAFRGYLITNKPKAALHMEYGLISLAGAEGLEPSTYGFGVRVILFSAFVHRYENWRY